LRKEGFPEECTDLRREAEGDADARRGESGTLGS